MQYQRQNFNYIGEVGDTDHISLMQGNAVQRKCEVENSNEMIKNIEGMESMGEQIPLSKSAVQVPGFRAPWSVSTITKNDKGISVRDSEYVNVAKSEQIDNDKMDNLEQMFTQELANYKTLLERYYNEYKNKIGVGMEYTDIPYQIKTPNGAKGHHSMYVNKYDIRIKTPSDRTNGGMFFENKRCNAGPDNSREVASYDEYVSEMRNLGYTFPSGSNSTQQVSTSYPCYLEGRNVINKVTKEVGYVNKYGKLSLWEGNNTNNSTGTCPNNLPVQLSPEEWTALPRSGRIMDNNAMCDGFAFINPQLLNDLKQSNTKLIDLAREMNKFTNSIYDIIGEINLDRENARSRMKANLEEFEKIYKSFDISKHKRKLATYKQRASDEQMLATSSNIGYTAFLVGALAVGIGAMKFMK